MGSRLYSQRLKIRYTKPAGSKPKAFKSEESANKWAKEHGIKKYILRNIRPEGKRKKIKIVKV